MQRLVLFCLLVLSATSSMAAWKIDTHSRKAEFPHEARFIEISFLNGSKVAQAHVFIFPQKYYRFAMVDNPTKDLSLDAAMLASGAIAGVNGGYFQTDFSPMGLRISEGKMLNSILRAKLLSGILVASTSGKPEIIPSTAFSSESNLKTAIQCGPNIMRTGKPVAGLNAVRPARRTIVATDGKGLWALIILSPVTLADSAEMLALPNVLGNTSIMTALNLDGGSSTSMWVKTSPTPFYLPSYATVRDYLTVLPIGH